jgi:TolA-binding protein
LPGNRNWWTVLSAVAAGLLVGFAASTLAYRLQLLRVPATGIVQRMDRELHLTEAQKSRIGEVLDTTRTRIEQLRGQFQSQRQQALSNAFNDIRATLTPAQQRDFDRLYNPRSVSPPGKTAARQP